MSNPLPFHDSQQIPFLSQSVEEALARLQYVTEYHQPFAIMRGEIGTGKSRLLNYFSQEQQRQGVSVATINVQGLSGTDLLWEICSALKWLAFPAEQAIMQRRLIDGLQANVYEQQPLLILLDQAQSATDSLWLTLAQILHHSSQAEKHCSLILCGDHTLMQACPSHLVDQCVLNIDLLPWEVADIGRYIAQELTHFQQEELSFTSEACKKIGQLTGGRIRKINQLAQLAVLIAGGEGMTTLDNEVIQSIHEELTSSPVARVA